jgi:cell shape-determining protein MreC
MVTITWKLYADRNNSFQDEINPDEKQEIAEKNKIIMEQSLQIKALMEENNNLKQLVNKNQYYCSDNSIL